MTVEIWRVRMDVRDMCAHECITEVERYVKTRLWLRRRLRVWRTLLFAIVLNESSKQN